MESIYAELADRKRNDIVLGNYAEEERLSETQLCETHKVSRTPVRLALRILESEGVIQRGEGRGYKVQIPTVADILQAVQVRGHPTLSRTPLPTPLIDQHFYLKTGEA